MKNCGSSLARARSLHYSSILRPLLQWKQGCQILLGTWYQIPEKCTKWTQSVPNGHKISQMSVKYS
jgi:hypothetical protein